MRSPSKQQYTLLSSSSDTAGYAKTSQEHGSIRPAWPSKGFSRLTISIIFVQTSVICVLSVALYRAHVQQASFNGQVLYSPAQDAVLYEARRFAIEDPKPNVYMGEPADELDKAWNNLYNYIGISQIHDSQARLMPNVSDPIPLDSRPQYHVVQLSVFHQIHCLNMIRKALRADYYPHVFKGTLPWKHLDHCVEALRQAVMCASDISPIPWRYSVERDQYIPHSDVLHSCRSFEKIADWARDNLIEQRMAEFLNLTAA